MEVFTAVSLHRVAVGRSPHTHSPRQSQRGNSYQDLLLSYVGYQFGRHTAQGRFATDEEAARWLNMMLTPTDLGSVRRSDPFYDDAVRLQDRLGQVRKLSK